MGVNPSDRIQPIRGGDMLAPATCMVCGRGPIKPSEIFTDLNVFHEWDHIQCYLCPDCTNNAAAVHDGVSYDKAKALALRNSDLEQMNTSSLTRIKELEQVVDNLSRERLTSRYGTEFTVGDLPDSAVVESIVHGNESDELSSERITNLEPEFIEPSTDSGPDDITSIASDDSIIDTTDPNSSAGILAELGIQ